MGWDRSRKESLRWLEAKMKPYPPRIRKMVIQGWMRRVSSYRAKNPTKSANIYARKAVESLEAVRARYPFRYMSQLYRREKLEAWANDCAAGAMALLSAVEPANDYNETVRSTYKRLAAFTKGRGVEPPAVPGDLPPDELAPWHESGILRMIAGEWWIGRLSALRDQCVEHIQLAAGMVGRGTPYLSDASFKEWKASQRKQADWAKDTELEDKDGNVVSMAQVVEAGIANPEHRRIELMIRLRGLEEAATDAGQVAYFLTFTAPSRYHSNSRKWDTASPRDGQLWLRKVWARIRAKLDREGIERSGCRVAEPHKDGCPHWHMLVFVKPEQAALMLEICREYALSDDGHEAGAHKHRFTVERIDPSKGSATGYIAKYISKNINGAHMDTETDHEAAKPANEGAERVRAWASRWRLRQFQFFGTAPITIYRELRRLREAVPVEAIEQARALADTARWAEFAQLAHGLKLEKEITPEAGKYGDFVCSVIGVRAGDQVVCTRPRRWRQKKRDSASPWSTGNNCTAPVSGAVPPHLSSAVDALGLEPEAAHHLLAGSGVFRNTGDTIYRIRENELKEYPY